MKKKLAFFLAVILAFSMTSTVFANGSAGTLSGAGTASVLNPSEVIAVTLPTTANFNFRLDPLGLLSMDHNWATPLPVSDIPGEGTILWNNFAPTFLNRSSVPIRLGVGFGVTTTDAAAGVNVLGTNAVAEDTARNVFVQARTATSKVTNTTTTLSPGQFTTVAQPLVAPGQIRLLEYVLTNAAYNVVRTGTTPNYNFGLLIDPTAENASGTQVTLAGVINHRADWSGDVDMGIVVEWSVERNLDGQAAAPDIANSFGLKRVTNPASIFNSIDVAPTYGFAAASVEIPRATKTAVPFVFPDGVRVSRVTSRTAGQTPAQASAQAQNTNWTANDADRAANQIRLQFGSAREVIIRVELSNDAYSEIALRVN